MNLPNINKYLLSHESSVSGLRMLLSLFIPRLYSYFSCQKRKTLPTYIQKPRSGLYQHVPCQECTSRCTCTTPSHAKAGPHRHLVTPAHPTPRHYLSWWFLNQRFIDITLGGSGFGYLSV